MNQHLTSLGVELGRTGWQHDPLFVPDELVFRMFGRARQAKDEARVGMLSRVMSRRLLRLAGGFVVRSGIFPALPS